MPRVTLWVDALEPQPSGIGRYTWELCRGLAAHPDIDSLRFYARRRIIDDPGALLRGDRLLRRRNAWSNWWDKRAAASSSIVHGPNYFLPSFAESGVITVHDLSVFRFPETHPAARVAAFERNFLKSLSRASYIITDTEVVRQEVIDSFSVAPDTITAIPLGVSAAYRPRPVDEVRPALAGLGLESRAYGLCVSTLEPRKKILELLAAWRCLPSSLRTAHPLVLAGGSGWLNDHLHDKIATGVAEGWLRHLGFVDEALLPVLYAGAALFVYPSSYEGFGLPPLEAMASGVPVLVSRHSCLPEVCGNAASYVDPDDTDGFHRALVAALSDRDWQTKSVALGLARSAESTWARCVDRTVAVYRKAENLAARANL